ncbi:MAG: EAL domain-containing protein [Rhodospirillales bacterium]|nr:EAL domain-containing protein [Rhodospirillales bacterium]
MADDERRLARMITCMAVTVAILSAVVAPLAILHAGYGRHVDRIDLLAAALGRDITAMAARNPVLWPFEHQRLLAILPEVPAAGEEASRVLAASGAPIVGKPSPAVDAVAAPRIVRSAPIYDAGEVVGRAEVIWSMRPLLLDTALAAAVSLVVAIGLFLVVRNVPLRALRKATAHIAYLDSHDRLTALPNRTLFADRLEQAIVHARRSGESVAVLCLDLDHFKDVNDALGHAVGDRLLQVAAARIGECLRKSDTLARLGADEFAIIQCGSQQPEDAAALAQRIIDRLREKFTFAADEIVIGCSIGIAVYSGRGTGSTLLGQAGLTLHRVKSEARGTYHFFEERMNDRLKTRRTMECDIRRALEAGDQFQVHYQPQFALGSGRLVGAEALVRWRHPQRGVIPPGAFIAIAEETGLIVPLGEWVLRTACLEANRWRPLRIAVNLSPAQFRIAGLAESIASVVGETGIDPQRLELEITEGVLLTDTEQTLTTLKALKSIGVEIAMDDFGTGYSSLSYLRRFPIDRIKIDGTFVRDLESGDGGLAIVRAVIALGASLAMQTTAEGVETPEQARRLRELGCNEAQGYLFSPPLPAAEFAAYVARHLDREVVPFSVRR